MTYRVILADPPWHFAVRSPKGEGRSACRHYNVMSLDAIKALPVADLADKDCVLLLWSLNSMRPHALDVIEAWGFKFKTTCFTWAKTNRTKPGFSFGCGYYSRQNTERVLLGTRGCPRRLRRDVPELVVAPRREHSRKPDEVRTSIERLFNGPYLELFARNRAPGWDVWGDEVADSIAWEVGQ